MATGIYRITLKSDEQKGASSPNIIEIGLASDADASTIGNNFAQLCSASFTSADSELTTNYALPYPAGTEWSGRCAFGNAAGYRQNVPWSNAKVPFDPSTRVPALIAAGWLMVGYQNSIHSAPTYGNAQLFMLQPSV